MNISVVIPAFNEEKRIGHCLKSVFNQTVKPQEVIVVDNNSTDKTAEIARAMGARVIIQPIQGVTFARNLGFDVAKGEIIARTDADTIVPSNWIEKYNDHFEEDPLLDALSGPAIFGISLFTPLLKLIVFETNKKIFGHYGLFGPNLAIRKSAWLKIRDKVCMDDEKVHEDTDLAIHIGKVGKVGYARDLKVRTSARRLRQSPSSLLVDYMVKWADMIAFHKQSRITTLAFRVNNKINN